MWRAQLGRHSVQWRLPQQSGLPSFRMRPHIETWHAHSCCGGNAFCLVAQVTWSKKQVSSIAVSQDPRASIILSGLSWKARGCICIQGFYLLLYGGGR